MVLMIRMKLQSWPSPIMIKIKMTMIKNNRTTKTMRTTMSKYSKTKTRLILPRSRMTSLFQTIETKRFTI